VNNVSGARIELKQVSRRFVVGQMQSIVAVDDISLDIPGGSSVALTGPSGSGKSTLLHLIGALDMAASGSITVDGQELSGMKERDLAPYRRSIGFVFQRYNLLPALTLLDNVIAPVLPYRTEFDKKDRARELLKAVGLADRETSLPSRLSGGQQQRVAIARALINSPRLLLADEPTGNLDSHTGEDVITLLMQLRTERGTTIIIATHDFSVASRCDRIVRLRDGVIVDDEPVTAEEVSDTMLGRIRGAAPQ
jgi:putative ABC transport system ATP-binding protein